MKIMLEIDENIYSENEFEAIKEILKGDGSLKLLSENVENEDGNSEIIGTITSVKNIKLDE